MNISFSFFSKRTLSTEAASLSPESTTIWSSVRIFLRMSLLVSRMSNKFYWSMHSATYESMPTFIEFFVTILTRFPFFWLITFPRTWS